MKYKVGDKVKIRSWADMEQEFGLNDRGSIKIPMVSFVKEMKPWCNKVVTIKAISINYYFIKDDEYLWTDAMIDHRVPIPNAINIINRLKKLKKLTSNRDIKINIDKKIKNLKSGSPEFTSYDVNYYNMIFKELKAGKLK